MAKNTGKPYEVFVAEIYEALTKDERFTKVERDVRLEGPDGPRQIDILLRSQVANLSLLTVIECRDYSSRLDVKHVDELHSKLIDVKAHKGVLVSVEGFSKMARSKAARLGITLCLVSEASKLLKEIGAKIPVRVHEILWTYNVKFKLHVQSPNRSFADGAGLSVNGVDLLQSLHEELLSGKLVAPLRDSEIDWLPSCLCPPHSISNTCGEPIRITGLTIRVGFHVRYYFGHVDDIPGIAAIHEMDANSTTLLFRETDVPNIIPSLRKFRAPEEIPPLPALTINLIAKPQSPRGS